MRSKAMRGRAAGLLGATCVLIADAAAGHLKVNTSAAGQVFHGLGAISGGGATSRLLVDYVEPQRSQILDFLFKPNYGASLQVFKVEIGGDSQSTDGTEPSHMHSADDLDYKRGYEWWLLKEAKKRNPEIKTYGLPWAYPGWVGGPELSGDPFKHPNLTSTYILKWLEGARDVYGIDVDYIGIWNERASDASYAKTLRQTLNAAGFGHTKLVAKDGDATICNEMALDRGYQKAIDVVGLHYPSDFHDYSNCTRLGYGVPGGKPLWASEESSSYDDANGAACWARVVASHWVLQGMTSSIMWNLVGSYFHGTNWYASSLLTAVEPWSGFYTNTEALWATAHVTQFTKVGWNLLRVGEGSGELAGGGFYVGYASPSGTDWTLTVVKIDEDHAPCTRPPLPSFKVVPENVTFNVTSPSAAQRLAVWYSNFESVNGKSEKGPIFQRLPDIDLVNGTFSLEIKVGAYYTVSTILKGPQKGTPKTPIPRSQPLMPLPFFDNFKGYQTSQEGRYWSDQIGAFEVHDAADGERVLQQMVPAKPIGWGDHGTNGPVTVLGMREWQDLSISASFRLPVGAPVAAAGCVGLRVDQMWYNGIVICLQADGAWSLTVGGPKLGGGPQGLVYAQGTIPAPASRSFTRLTLTVIHDAASGFVEPCGPRASCDLFEGLTVRDIDTGFAAIGLSGWFQAQFANVSIKQAGPDWTLPETCPGAVSGSLLKVAPCHRNGPTGKEQVWDLLPSWLLLHRASGLCARAASSAPGAPLNLAACDSQDSLMQFRNDYTTVRNRLEPFRLKVDSSTLQLTGEAFHRSVTVETGHDETSAQASRWQVWSYFPNSGQLRNQYDSDPKLGYPMCLTVCGPDAELSLVQYI